MAQQQVVKQWLDRVLTPYPSSDTLSREALAALAKFPTLSIKTDAYTYDSGQTHLLLQLHGTIPITYRSQTYHIPIIVWFPLEYPRRPPIAYVNPTKDMLIRKSKEVEPSGKVGGDMVEMWERKWEAHSLAAMLSWMQDLFSNQPPVYARPPPGSTPVTPNSPSYRSESPANPPPRPNPPNQPRMPDVNSAGNVNESGMPPVIPARPRQLVMPGTSGYGGPSHGSGSQESLPAYKPGPARPNPPASPLRASSIQSYGSPQPGSSSTPPPRPGPPTIAGRPASGYDRTYDSPGSPVTPTLYGPGAETRTSQTFQPQYYPPQSSFSHPPRDLAAQNGPPQPTRSATMPQSMNGPIGYPQPNNAGFGLVSQPRAAPKPPIADLLSDDGIPEMAGPSASMTNGAPHDRPIPPATLHLHSLVHSHLSSRLPPLLEHLRMQTSQLLGVQADLASGEPAIKDEMARLEAVRAVCAGVADKVGAVVTAGEERVRDLEKRGEVAVDEVVCSVSIVHNQLIDLVAEDNAIEDTIYHLARALDAERIDLNTFLKQTRNLAREQYQKRALIEKIKDELEKGRPTE